MHLCTCLTCASLHFPVYFPCACIYALHSVHALRMPLCLSLPSFPAHASAHRYCLLSLRMPPCISLSTYSMQLSCAEHNDFTGLRDAFGKNPSRQQKPSFRLLLNERKIPGKAKTSSNTRKPNKSRRAGTSLKMALLAFASCTDWIT